MMPGGLDIVIETGQFHLVVLIDLSMLRIPLARAAKPQAFVPHRALNRALEYLRGVGLSMLTVAELSASQSSGANGWPAGIKAAC